MVARLVKGMNPLLQYISDLLSFFQSKTIHTPVKFRDQAVAVKESLKEDYSGIVNTVLDFAIECALVSYRIDCSSQNLEENLNQWLTNINESYRGKIPTGFEPLAKEYFRERWKASSHILLRTIWEVDKKTGLELPTVMFFVDGEDVKCKPKDPDTKVIVLGEEQYYLRTSADEKDDIKLPQSEKEVIFVQKPYDSWGTYEPTPYLIRKGVWRNMQMMKLLTEKGEFVVSKALEYLFLVKKGTERLALDGNITYSEEDLKKVTEDLKVAIDKKSNEGGAPTYATQFDTSMEHLIPDYSKILSEGIYAPVERKLLSGLGLVELIQGISGSRREAVLNPKPFIAEVNQGIKDFKALIIDVVKEIIARNDTKHRKWMKEEIQIATPPISSFMDADFRNILRSLYDRGLLSKRTATEVLGELDYDIEKQRRESEKELGDDDVMFPPVITNIDEQLGKLSADPKGDPADEDTNAEDVPDDKKGLEKKNYNNSSYENNSELPSVVKKYPESAQDVYRTTFNTAMEKYKKEPTASKAAWSALKKFVKSNKAKLELEVSAINEDIETIRKTEELSLIKEKRQLLKKLLEEGKK